MSVPKETSVPRRWGSEIIKFGVEQLYCGQVSMHREEIMRLTFRGLGPHHNEIGFFWPVGMFFNK